MPPLRRSHGPLALPPCSGRCHLTPAVTVASPARDLPAAVGPWITTRRTQRSSVTWPAPAVRHRTSPLSPLRCLGHQALRPPACFQRTKYFRQARNTCTYATNPCVLPPTLNRRNTSSPSRPSGFPPRRHPHPVPLAARLARHPELAFPSPTRPNQLTPGRVSSRRSERLKTLLCTWDDPVGVFYVWVPKRI